MDELRRIIEDSEIMAEDDELWPQPDRVGDDITNDEIQAVFLTPPPPSPPEFAEYWPVSNCFR